MPRAPFNVLVIPYLRRYGVLEFALFYRRRPKMCQFIAGGGEDDENPLAAAHREAFEEAQIRRSDGWITLDATASIPRSAFPEATWPRTVFVIPEYSFAVAVGEMIFSLSAEHERYAWMNYQNAHHALTWDSNRVALYELHERLLSSDQDLS